MIRRIGCSATTLHLNAGFRLASFSRAGAAKGRRSGFWFQDADGAASLPSIGSRRFMPLDRAYEMGHCRICYSNRPKRPAILVPLTS
jgi:hypothetical protein